MSKETDSVNLRAAIPWLTGFLLMTLVALFLRTPETIGRYLLLLTIAWIALFFGWARTTHSTLLRQILKYSVILSLFQVFPDWVLSRYLNALVFPPDGLFKWDTVSGYMALLWAIPTSTILVTYYFFKEQLNGKIAYAAALTVGALLFIGSEELVWILPSWYAVNVVKWGHVARYIIVPELILTALIITVFERVRGRPLWHYVISALAVSLAYTAAAVSFYFIAG